MRLTFKVKVDTQKLTVNFWEGRIESGGAVFCSEGVQRFDVATTQVCAHSRPKGGPHRNCARGAAEG